ncbi:MAG: X2-like carbohydrate binding domain-containing protein [Eubacterium sp.]
MKKRILSIVLAICLVLTLVPITAFADSDSHTVTVNAGEGGKVSTNGASWSDSVEVAVDDGETLGDKVQYKANEGYKFDGVIPKIVSVAAGGYHTVLLDEDGNVWTAGYNDHGQLGKDGGNSSIFTQITVGDGVKIKSIAAGDSYNVLLDEDGNVWTAGFNKFGQLGRDENINTGKANPTFAQATVIPEAITFDELTSIPITFNSVWFVKFKDIQKPVITGLENNKTYCDDVEFAVFDNDGIASVKANDVELTASDGKYTLEKGMGTVKVVATDNSGNSTTVTVTMKSISSITEPIDDVKAVEDLIEALPDTFEPDDLDAVQSILDAKDAYDALTDYEKSLISEDAKEKLDALVASISDYIVYEGNGGIWTIGQGGTLTFTANGAYSKFTGIKVDGEDVDESNYTAKSGSTIITLNADYLDTLSVGTHTLTVLYTDGEAEAEFEVKKAPAETTNPNKNESKTSPNTGTYFGFSAFSVLLLFCLFAFIYKLKKRNQYNQ